MAGARDAAAKGAGGAEPRSDPASRARLRPRTTLRPMSQFARRRDAGEEGRASALELFYDLVFVFAITQISHLLLHDLSWRGVWHSALVLMVVWWAWNYTTWVTNELDPDSSAVRLLLIGIMLASLLMAVAIPEAFGTLALLFAASYV